MLTGRLLFTLLALVIAPVLSAPIPSETSLARRAEDSTDIAPRAVLAARAPRPPSSKAKSKGRTKTPSKKSSSNKNKKGKHSKSKWLYRRGTPAKVNDEVTIAGTKVTLKEVPNYSNKAGDCYTFLVDWKGKKAYAKQFISGNAKDFQKEINATKKLSEKLGNEQFLGAEDGKWLVTKEVPGKSFAEWKAEGKLTNDKESVAKAVATVLHAQEWLANNVGFMQNDPNAANWLFSDATLSEVHAIDLGKILEVPKWMDAMKSGQETQWKGSFENAWKNAKSG